MLSTFILLFTWHHFYERNTKRSISLSKHILLNGYECEYFWLVSNPSNFNNSMNHFESNLFKLWYTKQERKQSYLFCCVLIFNNEIDNRKDMHGTSLKVLLHRKGICSLLCRNKRYHTFWNYDIWFYTIYWQKWYKSYLG